MPAWIADPQAFPEAKAAAVVFDPPDPPTDVVTNQQSYDVESYSLILRPKFETEELDGEVHMVLTSLADSLDRIVLDLYDNLQVRNVRGAGGDMLDFEHRDDRLDVGLDVPLMTGESTTLSVVYHGAPQPSGFMGFEFNQTPAGNPVLATLSEPYYARSWWPCKDVPTDKALVTLTAYAPQGMFVASNGTLIQKISAGTGAYHVWQNGYPISTYNVSLAIADYESWSETYVSQVSGRSLPIEYHVFPEHRAAAEIDFAHTGEILALYEELFGEYPFTLDKYGMAEFVWEGAMEHQTMTSYGDFFLTGDQFYERIVGHELAHQWFGNSTTVSDWDEIWLHEGLATYAEALWIEHRGGPEAYQSFMRSRSASCCGFNGPIVPPNNLFNQTVYFKGAWVYHMLRRMIGDEAFFGALQQLAHREELRYSNFTTEDLITVFESSSGEELSWFFDQWLYREGRPTLDLEWSSVSDEFPYTVSVGIRQADEQDPWVMPVDVGLVTSKGLQIHRVWAGTAQRQVTLSSSEPILDVELDPQGWLLHFEEELATGAPTARGHSTRLLPNRPNPFNPSTVLRFELATSSRVTLRILDHRGRVVDRIDAGLREAGRHELRWDGTDRHGASVGSGVYRVVLEADGRRSSRAITLVE